MRPDRTQRRTEVETRTTTETAAFRGPNIKTGKIPAKRRFNLKLTGNLS